MGFRAGYIESWGRGTVNMVNYCREAGVPEPVFENRWGGLAVPFVRKNGIRPWEEAGNEKLGEELTKNQVEIMRLMSDNTKITIPVIATTLKISTTAVEKNIKKLREMGFIIRRGPARGGHWEIINK